MIAEAIAQRLWQQKENRLKFVKSSMQKILFVDLFSGIAGIRLAFEQSANSLNIKTECVLSSE